MAHKLDRDVVVRLVTESPVLCAVSRQFRCDQSDAVYQHACRTLLDAVEPRWTRIPLGILLWEWIATRNAAAVDALIAVFGAKALVEEGKMARNDLIAHDILRMDDVVLLRRFVNLGMLVPNETWILKAVQVAADQCFLFLCKRFKSISDWLSPYAFRDIRAILFIRHRSDLLFAWGWLPDDYIDSDAMLSVELVEPSESLFRALLNQAPGRFASYFMRAKSPVLYHAGREAILGVVPHIQCDCIVMENDPDDCAFVSWAQAFAPEIVGCFDM